MSLTKMEQVKAMVYEATGLRVNVSPGTNPDATAEDIAQEVIRVIAAVEAGDFEVVD
jgi:hypothetical protein